MACTFQDGRYRLHAKYSMVSPILKEGHKIKMNIRSCAKGLNSYDLKTKKMSNLMKMTRHVKMKHLILQKCGRTSSCSYSLRYVKKLKTFGVEQTFLQS